MVVGTRRELLSDLADLVTSTPRDHPLRVGVDGPPASGKTTLADELAGVLRQRGLEVIRATIEDFLFPEVHRYRRGEYCAEGCYFDNHDYEALTGVLLDPLGPGGDRRIRTAVYDRVQDREVHQAVTTVAENAVLVFDGVFLVRPELCDRWDVRIFVSVDFDRTVERALVREGGTRAAADIERRWRERYIPSQELYFAAAQPVEHADVVVVNDDLEQPGWVVRGR